MRKNGYFTPKRELFTLTCITTSFKDGKFLGREETWESCRELHNDKMWEQRYYNRCDSFRHRLWEKWNNKEEIHNGNDNISRLL